MTFNMNKYSRRVYERIDRVRNGTASPSDIVSYSIDQNFLHDAWNIEGPKLPEGAVAKAIAEMRAEQAAK